MAHKLNQVIAIEKGVKARTYGVVSEMYRVVQKAALFDGVTRVYRAKDDDGEELPPERKVVQYRARDVLGTVRINVGALMDITIQKDLANMEATANVKIDGKEVLPALPVTSLLFLEKQLTDLRAFVAALPVLDIAESWDYDGTSGQYKTQPVQTHRTKKVQRPLVLYDATDKHPAQTQLITEDVIAGFWETVKFSAALPAPTKENIVGRVDKLLIAVKEAREEANSIDASNKPPVGARVFDYLMGEDLV